MFFINLVFVDKKTIWRLNKKYRGVDKPTTVLSFYYGAPTGALAKKRGSTSPRLSSELRLGQGQANFPIGEVFICPAEAKRQNIKIGDLVKHGVNNILSEIPTTENLGVGLNRD